MSLLLLLSLPLSLFVSLPAGLAGQDGGDGEADLWYDSLDEYAPGLVVIRVDSAYSFQASSYAEISAALRREGPDLPGRPRDTWALHRRWMRYKLRDEELQDGRCRIVDPTVMVRTLILMPEWANESRANPDLWRDWQVFSARLRKHEESHRTLLLATATKFIQQVEKVEAGSCPEARDEARALWRGILAEGQAAQERFDATAVEVGWPPG